MNLNRFSFRVGDIVFADIVQRGREVLSLKLTGISSLGQLVGYLRSLVDRDLGRVVMKIRNFSQGWNFEQPLILRALPLPEGRQLTLF